jgi:RNase P subunit RPR2
MTEFESEFAMIPGSSLRRAFCSQCKEPMRVTYENALYSHVNKTLIICQDCEEEDSERQSRSIDSAFKLTSRQREKKQ